MLKNLKLLLGQKGDENNDFLMLQLDTVVQKVLNYCHREDLPEGLELVVAEMTANVVRSSLSSQGESGEQKVVSIKRGDTTIQYSSGESYNAMTGAGGADFIKNYIAQLNAYRRLKTL